MARTIEELAKRYARSENMKSPRVPMGGPRRGPGGPRGSGKPKNVGATVKRLCSYLAKYRIQLFFAFFMMIINTVTSLIGSYMLAPVIDKLWVSVKPDYEVNMSAMEKTADRIITSVCEKFGSTTLAYVASGIAVLAAVYIVGIGRVVSSEQAHAFGNTGALQTIRNDLFEKLRRSPSAFSTRRRRATL